jgi:hypothetical protein
LSNAITIPKSNEGKSFQASLKDYHQGYLPNQHAGYQYELSKNFSGMQPDKPAQKNSIKQLGNLKMKI